MQMVVQDMGDMIRVIRATEIDGVLICAHSHMKPARAHTQELNVSEDCIIASAHIIHYRHLALSAQGGAERKVTKSD